jgi:hypothetical protein
MDASNDKKTDAIRASDSLFAEQGMDEISISISLADLCPPFQDDPVHPTLVIQNGQEVEFH